MNISKLQTDLFIKQHNITLGSYMSLSPDNKEYVAKNLLDQIILEGYVKFLGVTTNNGLIIEYVQIDLNQDYNNRLQIICLDKSLTDLNWVAA